MLFFQACGDRHSVSFKNCLLPTALCLILRARCILPADSSVLHFPPIRLQRIPAYSCTATSIFTTFPPAGSHEKGLLDEFFLNKWFAGAGTGSNPAFLNSITALGICAASVTRIKVFSLPNSEKKVFASSPVFRFVASSLISDSFTPWDNVLCT